MGKKGRSKPKAKRTGKSRSRGKRAGISRAIRERKSTKAIDANYLTNLSDYEPVRQDDLNEAVGKVDDMEEEDLDVFHHSGTDLKFLTGVNLEKDLKQYKRKRKALENIVESYEKQPRLAGKWWNYRQHILLPLKGSTGIIQQITQISQTDDPSNVVEDVDNMSSTTDHGICLAAMEATVSSIEENIPKATLSAVDLLKMRQEKIESGKLLITNLVSAVLEDPDTNIEKLNDMNRLCEDKNSDVSVTVRKLAIVSLLEVFKDIIPGYRIRPLSESEKTIKVSKDVKKIRKFEEGLLKSYQRYLEILEQTAKERRPNKKSQKLTQKDLPMIALNCLCDLLLTVPHFNYRTNIMAVLVPRMNNKSGDVKVSKLCCQTIHTIFKTDSVGEISLEIVKLISKFVKSQSFNVKPCVLETFLFLRLQDADLGKKDNDVASEKPKYKNRLDKANRKRISKSDRKRHKELKKIERELQEAEAVEGKEKSKKLHTEIIKLVFFVYFRVLKAGVSPLLAPVLVGLSKYTHLINIDFFADLMSVLQTLIKSQEIYFSNKLHCILTAFKILSGQGEALNIDPQTFYTHLYSALLNVSPVTRDSDVSVALQCLDVMLAKRRKQVSIQRLMAYIKRLCTMSLQQCPSIALALLACSRTFLQMHAKAGIILDSDCSSGGVFRPDIEDPEYCNADGTTLWELYVFRNHYDQTLQNVALNISLGNPSQGPGSLPTHLARKNPLELFEEFKEDKRLFGYFKGSSLARMQKGQKMLHNKLSETTWYQNFIEEDVRNCCAWIGKQSDVDFGKILNDYV